jgi:uncharacterized protein YqhQ
LQAITTKPCDNAQVEVAITALNEVLAAEEQIGTFAEAEPLVQTPPLD